MPWAWHAVRPSPILNAAHSRSAPGGSARKRWRPTSSRLRGVAAHELQTMHAVVRMMRYSIRGRKAFGHNGFDRSSSKHSGGVRAPCTCCKGFGMLLSYHKCTATRSRNGPDLHALREKLGTFWVWRFPPQNLKAEPWQSSSSEQPSAMAARPSTVPWLKSSMAQTGSVC